MLPRCIIDAHVHLPIQPKLTPRQLVSRLREHGIGGAVILGVPSVKEILQHIDITHIEKEYGRIEYLIERYASDIKESLTPEALYLNVVNLLASYGELCEFEPSGENYAILAAANLAMDPERLADRLEALASLGFRGFKVLSTLFFKFLDDETVETVFEVADSKGLPVVVHTGCDPGIWELPKYCKYGDPSRLDSILSRHRDVVTVLAHLGGYSAIAPGVFTQEAVHLANKYERVYLDTSAVPPHLAGSAAKTLSTNKLIFGSDYPVIDNDDIRLFALQVARALRAAGYKARDIEATFHGFAEEIFGVRCSGDGL
ncbi:MAG: amidohydrolase family protein [Desulfurococcales archaeon]|nr:amidohydrolase family protein [Desulfurococcales archaeon]